MSDITYSPRARYRGWPGVGDGTIQHLEYKTTHLEQRLKILILHHEIKLDYLGIKLILNLQECCCA